MLQQGINLAPSPYEVAFISSAHTDKDIAQTITIATQILAELLAKIT